MEKNALSTKPKAILFDWDNTLADTWPLIHGALCDTLTAMGHEPWTLEYTKQSVHRSMRDSFPELFGERWEEAGKIYQQSYRKNREASLAAFPHTVELLEFLAAESGMYVAVVSNKMGTPLREEVAHLGWDRYFTKVIGAQDAGADKPSPEPVLMALEGSGISLGADVWFVGDSLTDMECAYNSGCTSVFYGEEAPCTDRYAHCFPHLHVTSHIELLNHLNKKA